MDDAPIQWNRAGGSFLRLVSGCGAGSAANRMALSRTSSEVAAMDTNRIGQILQAQFDRVWTMLRQALDRCSDEQLRSAQIPWLAPARQAFHIIDNASFYLHPDPDAFKWGRLCRAWATCAFDELPDRTEIRATLEAVERKTCVWLSSMSDTQWTAEQEKMPWTGKTMLDRALYALRHTQHHVGLINCELRRLGLPRPEWH
jgi:hypothetical protein